ncbi:hypothetical protein HR12_30880 [Microbacterium sp. SUBG005]|nr:hypothetical protein HR12_30880 [Microbacterium sp. SUBG005]
MSWGEERIAGRGERAVLGERCRNRRLERRQLVLDVSDPFGTDKTYLHSVQLVAIDRAEDGSFGFERLPDVALRLELVKKRGLSAGSRANRSESAADAEWLVCNVHIADRCSNADENVAGACSSERRRGEDPTGG